MMAPAGTSRSLEGLNAESQTVPRWLVWTSLGYLVFPLLVFLVGWLQPLWATLSVAGALAMTVLLALGQRPSPMPHGWRWWQGLVMVVVTGLVVSTQGAGGFGLQTWDWAKHLAILRDLMDRPWPVMYHTTKDTVSLTYYVAYYLPAALVGDAFGWTAANTALWLWTILGCALAGFWLVALSGTRWWLALLLLLLFSCCDIIGGFVRTNELAFKDFDLEWWSKHWTFPSNLTLIAYAPHQGIAGWLLTALLIHGLRTHAEKYHAAMLLVLSMLWSPFITIGLAIIYAGWLACHGAFWKSLLTAQCSWRNVPAFLMGLLLGLYFASKFIPYELPREFHSSKNITAKGEFYFTLDRVPGGEFAILYLLTLLLEFGLLSFLVFKGLPHKSRSDRALLASASVCLMLLPWVHYGRFNDLVMRVCIPALFVLQVLALQTLSTRSSREQNTGAAWARPALVALLIVGAIYPINMLNITRMRLEERTWRLYYLSDYHMHPDLFRQQRESRKLLYSIGQYMGASDSFFFRHLAKNPSPSGTITGKKPEPAP